MYMCVHVYNLSALYICVYILSWPILCANIQYYLLICCDFFLLSFITKIKSPNMAWVCVWFSEASQIHKCVWNVVVAQFMYSELIISKY